MTRRVGVLVAALGAAACYSSTSTADRQIIQVSDSKAGAYEAALAVRDYGFVAAWHDNRNGNAEIYLRPLDAAGQPSGPERRLTNGPEESYEASIDTVGDAVAIAWYDTSADSAQMPKVGVWELNGTNRWVRTLAPAGRNPVVRTYGGDVFCAWIAPGPDGGEWVWGGWWTREGEAQSPAQRLAPAGKTTWNLNAIADDHGRALVVFDATAGTKADEVFLVRYAPEGSSVARLTADDGRASKYPDIDGVQRLALTWFDERDGNKEVYLVTAAENDLEGEIDTRATRVTSTKGESIGAYLRWGAGERVGLAWSDDSEGQHEVFFQMFDAGAAPLAPATRLTRNPTSSLIPAIRATRDGFALLWNEFKPGGEAHAGTAEIAFTLVR